MNNVWIKTCGKHGNPTHKIVCCRVITRKYYLADVNLVVCSQTANISGYMVVDSRIGIDLKASCFFMVPTEFSFSLWIVFFTCVDTVVGPVEVPRPRGSQVTRCIITQCDDNKTLSCTQKYRQ